MARCSKFVERWRDKRTNHTTNMMAIRTVYLTSEVETWPRFFFQSVKVDSCGCLDPQLVRPGLTANIGMLNVQAMTERGGGS